MPPKQPLVLLFAGPSGHGKTELARNLGRLLGFDLRNVDCTNLKRETDLFGPWFPYQGWEKGSVVNNFLAGHNARQSIVFLDEFEKTEDEVRQALLVPFDSGKSQEKATGQKELKEADQPGRYMADLLCRYIRQLSRQTNPCRSQLFQDNLGACHERF